jgi:hypothetical protein
MRLSRISYQVDHVLYRNPRIIWIHTLLYCNTSLPYISIYYRLKMVGFWLDFGWAFYYESVNIPLLYRFIYNSHKRNGFTDGLSKSRGLLDYNLGHFSNNCLRYKIYVYLCAILRLLDRYLFFRINLIRLGGAR